MIIARQTPGTLHITTQTDHAALAAELLSLWRIDSLPENPRRGELLLAAREHDNGWQEADSAPARRDDGRPHDFLSIPGDWRRQIWQRGVRRHGEQRPWVSLLIVEHALNLHRRHLDAEPWRALMTEWRELREQLLETAGGDERALTEDYRLLDAVDTLSLAVCAGWGEPGEHAGVRYHVRLSEDRAEMLLDPFPLAGATTFPLRRRSIEDRAYARDVELGVELASARWQRFPVRILPWAQGFTGHSLE